MLVDSIEKYKKLKLLTYEILDNYSSFEFLSISEKIIMKGDGLPQILNLIMVVTTVTKKVNLYI